MIDIDELSESDIIRIIGVRLREYRLNARFTQKELASRAGVSHITVSQLESGKCRNITMTNFLALLRSLDLLNNIDDLVPELPVSPYSEPERRNNGRVKLTKKQIR